jgi:HAMP domain-containing protein
MAGGSRRSAPKLLRDSRFRAGAPQQSDVGSRREADAWERSGRVSPRGPAFTRGARAGATWPRECDMRLLAKFSLIFVVVFGLGLGGAAYLFYGNLQRNAREQVLQNAQLMMDTALAMRSYTITQVKPAITDAVGQSAKAEGSDDVFRELCAKHGFAAKQVFLPQTVPAYAATEMFIELRKKYPDYMYKEATLNPTNPRNRALDWEEDLIKMFKNRPDMENFDGERDTPFGKALFLAKPMRAPSACMECHSVPNAAPKGLIQRYGPNNGFGWKEGDIVAAQIVSVPVNVPIQMADHAFRRLLVSLVGVGILTLLVLDALLYATVIRPVARFAARADEISRGELDVPELPVRGRNEISILAAAFNRMHRSVTAAMQMLEQDAEPPPTDREPDDER